MGASNDIKELSVRPIIYEIADENTLLIKKKTSYGETKHRVYEAITLDDVFDFSGSLSLADYYKEKNLNVSDFKAPAAGAATKVNRGMGTAWRFDDGNEESIRAEVKIPCCWKSSYAVRICMVWDSPATNQDCDWEIRYLFRKDDEDMTETTPDGTLQSYETSSANANGLVQSVFNIPLANFDSDDKELIVQIFRDGNDVNDTLGDNAFFHSVCISGVANMLGRLA